MLRSSGLLAIGLGFTLVTACGGPAPRRDAPPVSPRPGPSIAPQAPAPAMSDAAYVSTAAAIDLYEIRSSELALQRSSNAAVREFAEMMISAHKGTSSQLSLAGRRLNLLPSATLSPRYQAMLDSLQDAGNFDALYRQQQTTVHREAVALHSAYAARGTSPTLRPLAAAILQVFQRHQRLLGYLP